MNIHPSLKWVFFRYQSLLWYVGQAANELDKPLRFVPLALQLLTLLGVYGFIFKWYQIGLVYGTLLIIAFLIGLVVVKSGITAYNNGLANKQNKELLEIRADVKELKVMLQQRGQ